MALSKLVFKPGINREGTNYSNEGGWHDGDKIRFRYGYPEKMGGWVKVNSSVFAGTPRRLHDFVTLSSQSLLFIATEKKAYLEESGTLYDITPYRRTVALPYEFASPGVQATTSIGSVAVLIGGTALTNLAIVSGVAAHATVGDVASVTVSTPYSYGVEASTSVGSVTVVAAPVNETVDLAYTNMTVSELGNELSSSVGNVRVVAYRI